MSNTRFTTGMVVITLLLIQLVFVCGCIVPQEPQEPQGLYRSGGKAIFFHGDNTFHRSEGPNGIWFERKGHVCLDDGTFHVVAWTIDGRDLIDAEGNRWIEDERRGD